METIISILLVIAIAAVIGLIFRPKKSAVEFPHEQRENAIFDEEVDSLTTRGVSLSGQNYWKYKVSSNSIICTCPDFEKRRVSFRLDDPQRLCKHLIHVLSEKEKLPKTAVQFLQTINLCKKNELGFPISKRIFYLNDSQRQIEIWLPHKDSDENGWCEIHVDGSRFGYNIFDNRWSYDRKPHEGRELESFILTNY